MPEFFCESWCGRRHAENQDRAIARPASENTPWSLIAVADGISTCPFGRSVAKWIVDEHLAVDEIPAHQEHDGSEWLAEYLSSLNRQFRDEFEDLPEMLESGACLSVAFHLAGETHCFWVGDSPIFQTTIEDGKYSTKQVSHPDSTDDTHITDWFGGTSPFQLKHVTMNRETSIVTITSDGVAHDAELLNSVYEELGFSEIVAKKVCDEALKNPNADDVSIVAMRVSG